MVRSFSSNITPVHGLNDINGETRIYDPFIDIGADKYFTDIIFTNGFE